MAETVRKAHERFPQFSQESCVASVHDPSLFHIGGAAYFVWASPPNRGCTAHRHGAVQRCTTSALIPSQQLVVQ